MIVLLWEILPQTGLINRVLFPTFTDVVGGFGTLVSGGYWWEDLGKTMMAVAISWVIGVSFGFIGTAASFSGDSMISLTHSSNSSSARVRRREQDRACSDHLLLPGVDRHHGGTCTSRSKRVQAHAVTEGE